VVDTELFDAVSGRDADRVGALLATAGPVEAGSVALRAFRQAIGAGFSEVVTTFLASGKFAASLSDTDGSTPLMWAAERGSVELVQMLLAGGAEVNHTDQNGWNALFFATRAQSAEIVELLLNAGADATLVDAEGRSVLEVAAYRQFSYHVPFLGSGGGEYRVVRDTPVRVLLKKHLARERP
jgi:ankyrin repeat protein